MWDPLDIRRDTDRKRVRLSQPARVRRTLFFYGFIVAVAPMLALLGDGKVLWEGYVLILGASSVGVLSIATSLVPAATLAACYRVTVAGIIAQGGFVIYIAVTGEAGVLCCLPLQFVLFITAPLLISDLIKAEAQVVDRHPRGFAVLPRVEPLDAEAVEEHHASDSERPK